MQMTSLTIGSLFSGIGGLELGLERAGLGPVVWQVERDPYCRAVLAKHWPNVKRYEDVHDVGRRNLAAVRVICAGVPCQPISQAAAHIARDDTSWLWPETARVVVELRPDLVVIEQPEAIRYARRGLARILSDLAAIGYDAIWQVVRASDVGAPHHRARLWVVAYTDAYRESAVSVDVKAPWLPEPHAPVSPWESLPDLRVADGIPTGLVRAERLGNAVVPQVAEVVGRVILALEAQRCAA
jgi:DNA (cytosine-5)-methyltransferase 1